MQTVHEKGRYLRVLPLLALSLLMASPAWAAGDGAEKPVPAPPVAVGPAPVPGDGAGERKSGRSGAAVEQERNPFAVTEKLARLTDKPEVPIPPLPAFTPQAKATKLPKMHMRGQLHGVKGKVLALLEIEGGGVYIVHEGDDVGLHELGLDSVIRIKKIHRLHMIVESGSLGQMIIVR